MFNFDEQKAESLASRVVGRSNNRSNANCGVSYANANNDASNANANYGSRLDNRNRDYLEREEPQ